MTDESLSATLREALPAVTRHKSTLQVVSVGGLVLLAIVLGQLPGVPLRPLVLCTVALMAAVLLGLEWLAHRALGSNSQQRRLMQDAFQGVTETRSLMRRFRHRLDQGARTALEGPLEILAGALRDRNDERALDGLRKLEERVDRYLSFAQKSPFREYAEPIAWAVLVALCLRAFVVEAFKIPSGSMIPTLEVGDHIFVNKFIYGLRLPVPGKKLKVFDFRKPRRGEVIVFIYPVEDDKDFIKRIIAVEGDRVTMQGHQIMVNGEPIPRRKIDGHYPVVDQDEGREKTYEEWEETVNGHPYLTINELGEPHRGSYKYLPITVPPGHVFVFGDNRDNSHDSRFWGPVPYDHIKGRAMFVWWSSNPHLDAAWQFWRRIRWDRLIKPIE
jgi:signal peptidase I